MDASPIRTYYDFFAGAGLVRLALGTAWQCLWANDIDPKKREVYVRNFGNSGFALKDVAHVRSADLPGRAALAWASIPCQDLSLAGPRAGMNGSRSGTFWHFQRVLKELADEGRLPKVIVVENVIGLLHGGGLDAVCQALAELDVRFGAVVIDARHFLPQSRPRVFVVGASPEAVDASRLAVSDLDPLPLLWFPKPLRQAFKRLPNHLKERWVWWRLPPPPSRRPALRQLLDEAPPDAPWHTDDVTRRFLDMMSPVNLEKVQEARRSRRLEVGTIYRRVRNGEQRAEIRLDGLAGCLRASRAGSSRLFLMFIEGDRTRSRRLSAREAARLMGVPDGFWLPARYSDAYHAVADGIAVPAVGWLAQHLLGPLADSARFPPRSAVAV